MNTAIKVTDSDYIRMNEEGGGICLACGDEAYGVEPDAKRYRCESCGALQVYGIEKCLLMELVEFVEG